MIHEFFDGIGAIRKGEEFVLFERRDQAIGGNQNRAQNMEYRVFVVIAASIFGEEIGDLDIAAGRAIGAKTFLPIKAACERVESLFFLLGEFGKNLVLTGQKITIWGNWSGMVPIDGIQKPFIVRNDIETVGQIRPTDFVMEWSVAVACLRKFVARRAKSFLEVRSGFPEVMTPPQNLQQIENLDSAGEPNRRCIRNAATNPHRTRQRPN